MAAASEAERAELEAQKAAADAAAAKAEQEANEKRAAEAAVTAAKEAAAAKAAQEVADAKAAFDIAFAAIESASTLDEVDQIVSDFVNSHTVLARKDLNLNAKALIRKSDIETPVVNADNVFTNLDAVADLTATATELEETAKAEALAAGKSQAEIEAALHRLLLDLIQYWKMLTRPTNLMKWL